jgi:hypothetical protein
MLEIGSGGGEMARLLNDISARGVAHKYLKAATAQLVKIPPPVIIDRHVLLHILVY